MDDEIQILIVDDEKAANKYIEYIILSLGFRALSASNREDCLQIVKSYEPDVIFLDIMLGDSNGFDICGEIKSDPDNSKPIIVMYSGMDFSSEDRERGLQVGIDGYLNKRSSIEEIKLTIQLYARLRLSENKLKESESSLHSSIKKIQHINSVLRALRNVNQVILEEDEYEEMVRGVCENLTNNHGYQSAWIGLLDNSGKYDLLVESGMGEGYSALKEKMCLNEIPECLNDILGSNEVVQIEEAQEGCSDCGIFKLQEEEGVLSVRIAHGQDIYGFLAVSLPAELLDEREEWDMLKVVASDIGIGLHNIHSAHQIYRLTNIVKTIPQPIACISAEYRYIAVNDIYAELYDSPIDEITGSRVEDYLGVELFNSVLKEKMDVCLSGQAVQFETQFNFKSGGLRWMLVDYNPLYNFNDKSTCIISHALDITGRKKGELELEKRMSELEIFNDAAVDRELRINELRAEVNNLLERAGDTPKYRIIE
ncbi:MAG: response regulator [Spirochaetales bacterium]|nr:response regulator [Spirochaetales bacterium]